MYHLGSVLERFPPRARFALRPLTALVLALGLGAAPLATGCGDSEPLTEIVLVVDSDWEDLSRVRIAFDNFSDADSVEVDLSKYELPLALPLVHDGGPLGPFGVTVSGFAKGEQEAAIVEPRTPIFFVEGKTRALRIELRAACLGKCSDRQGCVLNDADKPVCKDPEDLVRLTAWEGQANLPRLPVAMPDDHKDAGPTDMDAQMPMADAGMDANMPKPDASGPRDAQMDGQVDATMQDADTKAMCDPACGFTTADPNGTVACVEDTCVVTCKAGHADCDGVQENGCETDLATHCGPCQGQPVRRKPLTVPGAKITAELTGFPLLVQLEDAELGAASEAGTDLCFTAADGTTPLPFEIERWEQQTGSLTAWVQVPTLTAATDTKVYLYFGQDRATPFTLDKPWDASYQAVWHLSDGRDSSRAGLDASTPPEANRPSVMPGRIGDAQGFDGSDDYLQFDQNALDKLFAGPVTLEAWIYPTGWGEGSSTGASYGRILDKSSGTGPNGGWGFYVRDDSQCARTLNFGHAMEGGFYPARIWCGPNDALALNRWQHVAVVFDRASNSDPLLYVDGLPVMANQIPGSGSNSLTDDSASPLRIGQTASSNDRTFDGLIDEARISRASRSAAWLATGVANQSDPQGFWTVGPVETP